MTVISEGPSNAASNAAPSTSSKPSTVKTTNGRNKTSAVVDDSDGDDVSDEEVNKQSDSDDYEVICSSATCHFSDFIQCEAFY